MLQDEVLTWVTSHNFQNRFPADHVPAPSFPFLAFSIPCEEIQAFSGLLHKEFHIYFLLFHELLALEYSFEGNS